MRSKHIALSAALFMSLSGLAAGPAAASGAGDPGALQARKAHVDPTMAKRMQGSYRLDDGRTLRVSEKGHKLYADFGDGPIEIVHVGHDRFEAVERDVSLSFDGAPFPHAVFARIGPQRQVASSQR
ncbi:hypothetical protein [Massilia sp. HP4]|uniref:hypothetical protein n=1 Tax=Massilia sp. HP4 TaxID=2562316 RepID=UPI0010BFA50D|nr:hypothetical protein [Massilia sp. HP4]